MNRGERLRTAITSQLSYHACHSRNSCDFNETPRRIRSTGAKVWEQSHETLRNISNVQNRD